MSRVCANPLCDNAVPPRTGRVGRPPLYCSVECRPSRTRPVLTVEVDQDSSAAEAGRDWVVRLRRGPHVVVVRRDLGRFSAIGFATELRDLLGRNLAGSDPS